MPSDNRYTVTTIQNLRSSRIKKRRSKKQKKGRAALFAGDVLLCLVSALTIILVLYWLNNGAFRAAAPFTMAIAFALWRSSISKGIRVALQWVAFGIETVIYILLMPFKSLFTLLVKVFQKSAHKRQQKRLAKQRQTYTKKVMQQIDRDVERLLPIQIKTRTQKGDIHASQNKKAV